MDTDVKDPVTAAVLNENGKHLQAMNSALEESRKATVAMQVSTEKMFSWFKDGGFENAMKKAMESRGTCSDGICNKITETTEAVKETNGCMDKLSGKIQWIILPLIGILGTTVTIIFWLSKN